MTSAENSVSEPPSLKKLLGKDTPRPLPPFKARVGEDLGLTKVKFSRSPLITFDDFCDPPPRPWFHLPSKFGVFPLNPSKVFSDPPFCSHKNEVAFFFSLLRFLSVLIFKHKNQKNNSSVIKRLVLSDRPNFIVSSIMLDYRTVRLHTPRIIKLWIHLGG